MSATGVAVDRPAEDALTAEESRLAAQAAGGDGEAFAALYTRYEQRVYNLCLRITNSNEDAADATQDAFVNVMRRLPKLEGRELAFGSYLFTAARNASYDLIEKRKRAEPTDEIPEDATPAGIAGGLDPGDPEEDPERALLLESQQDEIREANGRLPERQREALALRELEGLSYDEIAEIMDMNRNSVAQLISRARINLRDELRQTALASVAAASEDCERALPLIASAQDGELAAGTEQDWLSQHLRACERCTVSVQAMEEAGASYRAWIPVAAAPWLFKETVAHAAEAVGTDWSAIERPSHYEDGATTELPGQAAARVGGAAAGGAGLVGTAVARLREHGGRAAALTGGLAAVLLLGVLTALADDDAPPVPVAAPVAEERPAPKPKKRERLSLSDFVKQAAGEPSASAPAAELGGASAPVAILQPGGTLLAVGPGGGTGGAPDPPGGEEGDSGAPGEGPSAVVPPTDSPAPVPTPAPDPTPPPATDPAPPSADPAPPTRNPGGGGRVCPDPRTGRPVPC